MPGDLLLCLALGGASAEGLIANAALQLLGVAAIFWFAAHAGAAVPGRPTLAVFALLIFVVVVAQLVPLPETVAGTLPGRGPITEGYRLLGVVPSVQSLSLDPDATIASALSLLPPFAVAIATLHATKLSRRIATVSLLATIVIEIVLGALQLNSGSRYYFYAITNLGSAVGFFANSNHMATLLLIGLPYVTAIAVGMQPSSRRRGKYQDPAWLMFALFLVICLGVALNGSVAGLGLLLPAVAASYLSYRRGRGLPVRGRLVLLLAIIAAALLAFAIFGPLHSLLLDHALSTADPTTRRTSNTLTALAAEKFFPFGSGLGTFQPIYQMQEDLFRVTTTYVNHAHDDYLELLLELGVAAPVLLALFLIWFLRRTFVVWRLDGDDAGLARAGSIAVGIILLHSLVDYPARTAAIAAVIGFSLALMASPVPVSAATRQVKPAGRHFTAEEATA